MLVASASIVVAAVLPAIAAGVGPLPLAAVLAVEQLLLGWAWVRVLAASGATLVIVLAAAPAADAIALITDSDEIGDWAGVVGVAVVAVILGQLARRRGGPAVPGADRGTTPQGAVPGSTGHASHGFPSRPPVRVTVDMAAGLSGVVVVTLLTSYLDTAGTRTPAGRTIGPVVVAAGLLGAGVAVLLARLGAAVHVARLHAAVHVWPVAGRFAGLVGGAAVGSLLGVLADGLEVLDGAMIAVVAAIAALIIDLAVARGVADLPGGDRRVAWFAQPLVSILPLAGAAAFVYELGHLLVG